jgi:hypothetical protein
MLMLNVHYIDKAEIHILLYYSTQFDKYKINIQQQYKVKSCDENFGTRQVGEVLNRLQ